MPEAQFGICLLDGPLSSKAADVSAMPAFEVFKAVKFAAGLHPMITHLVAVLYGVLLAIANFLAAEKCIRFVNRMYTSSQCYK